MNQERDESMARMMTEHVMRDGHKIVNTVSINSSVNLDEANFKAMYNEALQFLANQGGYRQSNPRSGGNQGWNSDCDNGWIDLDKK